MLRNELKKKSNFSCTERELTGKWKYLWRGCRESIKKRASQKIRAQIAHGPSMGILCARSEHEIPVQFPWAFLSTGFFDGMDFGQSLHGYLHFAVNSGSVLYCGWTNLCTIWLNGKRRHLRRPKLAAARSAAANFARRQDLFCLHNFAVLSA